MKSAFYGDLSDLEFLLALSHLHCDEPLGVVLRPTANTPARFGGFPRHFIPCLDDRAIPITAQDFMIGAVDEALWGKARTHTLAAGYLPFFSQPRRLADIMSQIARETAGRANVR